MKTGRHLPLLLGAAGAGLAFSTKGQIALLVIGLPLLCQLIYTGAWKRLWNPRVLLGLMVFALVISPVLYAYYQQFDLHPEKVIRGRDHRSGILFILWEQSFERLSGEGVGKNSSDYLFFFHTFLWVFLPWTLIGLGAFWERARAFWRNPKGGEGEVLTLGGIALIFVIISFAQFKLPHYLNITIPLFAVLSAAFLDRSFRQGKRRRLQTLGYVQLGIYGIVVAVVLLIALWVFPMQSGWALALVFVGAGLGIGLFFLWKDPLKRIVGISVFASVLLNGVMNAHFYPSLLAYQGGSEMADLVRRELPEVETLYKVSDQHTWALDFYFGKPLEMRPVESLPLQEAAWIYVNEKERDTLREAGISWDRELTVDQFRISRLQGRFLNPATRDQVLRKRYLLHIPPAP